MTTSSNIALPDAMQFRSLKQDWRVMLPRALPLVFALFAHLFPCASAAKFNVLDPLPETRIARIEKFVAADTFRVGNRIGGRILSAVGLNFTQHFIGVVEKDVPAISLGRWTLLYTTGDKFLIKSLGGEGQAALPFLAYVHQIMELGKQGAGHTDWRSNFAYVRSPVDQRLWAIHWSVNYQNEWVIGAVYVPHPDLDWRSGSLLFGRQTVLREFSCTAGIDAQIACQDGMAEDR